MKSLSVICLIFSFAPEWDYQYFADTGKSSELWPNNLCKSDLGWGHWTGFHMWMTEAGLWAQEVSRAGSLLLTKALLRRCLDQFQLLLSNPCPEFLLFRSTGLPSVRVQKVQIRMQIGRRTRTLMLGAISWCDSPEQCTLIVGIIIGNKDVQVQVVYDWRQAKRGSGFTPHMRVYVWVVG